jgi:hypothetical protein
MTIKRIGRVVAMGAALTTAFLAMPQRARAQAKFEVTPAAGSYYPLANVCTDCNNNNDGSNFVGKQLNSFAVGGSLSYWISNTLGVAAFFGWAPSRVEESEQDTLGLGISAGTSIKGNIILANARLLFRPARTNLHFIVGGGIVKRGGDFWKFIKDNSNAKLTSPAGILGVGVRASVTPKFALNVNAEGYFYSFDPKFGVGTDPSNGSKLQTDLLVTVGVPIAIGR